MVSTAAEFEEREERRLSARPVPAARPLSDFAVETIGDELIVLDVLSMQYHTLNAEAARVWSACDGVASAASIASALDLPVESVEAAVAQLGEAGLLQARSEEWDSTVSRRRVTKLIAAGLIGAVGLPVIKSITAPDAASADSPPPSLPNEVGASCTPASLGGGGCAPVAGSNASLAISCCNTSGPNWQCWSTNSYVPCEPSFVAPASFGNGADSFEVNTASLPEDGIPAGATDEQREVLQSIDETLQKIDDAQNGANVNLNAGSSDSAGADASSGDSGNSNSAPAAPDVQSQSSGPDSNSGGSDQSGGSASEEPTKETSG